MLGALQIGMGYKLSVAQRCLVTNDLRTCFLLLLLFFSLCFTFCWIPLNALLKNIKLGHKIETFYCTRCKHRLQHVSMCPCVQESGTRKVTIHFHFMLLLCVMTWIKAWASSKAPCIGIGQVNEGSVFWLMGHALRVRLLIQLLSLEKLDCCGHHIEG